MIVVRNIPGYKMLILKTGIYSSNNLTFCSVHVINLLFMGSRKLLIGLKSEWCMSFQIFVRKQQKHTGSDSWVNGKHCRWWGGESCFTLSHILCLVRLTFLPLSVLTSILLSFSLHPIIPSASQLSAPLLYLRFSFSISSFVLFSFCFSVYFCWVQKY